MKVFKVEYRIRDAYGGKAEEVGYFKYLLSAHAGILLDLKERFGQDDYSEINNDLYSLRATNTGDLTFEVLEPYRDTQIHYNKEYVIIPKEVKW